MCLQQNKENGFTLIETLITLSIVSILLFIVVPVQTNLVSKKKEDYFFDMLAYDMLYVQNMKLGRVEKWEFEIVENGYNIGLASGKNNIKRKLPNGWKWGVRPNRKLTYSLNGSLINPGSLNIKTENKEFKLIFPLGKGRFRIE